MIMRPLTQALLVHSKTLQTDMLQACRPLCTAHAADAVSARQMLFFSYCFEILQQHS